MLKLLALLLALSSALANETTDKTESLTGPILPYDEVDLSKVPSAPPEPMKKDEFTFGGLTRPYALFSPPKTLTAPGPRPLVVMLHGCLEDAESFAKVTKMNELAIRENAFILYPEQTSSNHPLKCWNWFDSANQATNPKEGPASERAWLAALIEIVRSKEKTDPRRTFIIGLSAGGAMTANMLSCHPELFAAGAIVAGVAYGAAENEEQAKSAMRGGSTSQAKVSAEKAYSCSGRTNGPPVKIFIAHGEADSIVNKVNSKDVLKHFEALNDLRDDGQANQSFQFKAKGSKTNRARRNRYAHTIENYKGGSSGSARFVKIKKLGHAWSGGGVGVEFSDPKGPAISDLIWDFFAAP